MPRKVLVATVIAIILHGILILAGGSRLGYDAYTHMLFADHYLHGWWSLWEPRWYTGFEVISYPPLTHQLLALLAYLTGIDKAYDLLLWSVVIVYPLAIYRFSRLFIAERAAGYAAIGAAFLPSLYLTAHTFGQLPTLVATLVALLSIPVLADFLLNGRLLTGALAVSMFATIIAAHHATLLFLPWVIGAVVIRLLSQKKTNKLLLLFRLGVFTLCAVLAGLVVIWPFWNWGRVQVEQTPIDHASRHNFFTDPSAAGMFFLAMYGLLIPLIPVALWLGRHKRFWGLTAAFLLLFILGLGGTTPLPRLLFGSGWAWLTYDRFSFWASLLLLPFFGVMLTRAKLINRVFKTTFWLLMGLAALVVGFMPSWLPTQPRQLDMQPIVQFLAQNHNSQYRYLTFGFGDQLAYLSRLTKSTTIDGSYHTARTLPELRSSGIGQIDTAFWIRGGMAALGLILQKSGERGVRWGFVNLETYIPVLQRNGWIYLFTLSNNVQVWENPASILPPAVIPPPEISFEQFSWGVFPLLALLITSGLALRFYRPALSGRVFLAIQAFAVGLLPLGLTFWYFRPLFSFQHARIYFTYSDALIFWCDGLAILSVLAWLVQITLVHSSTTKSRGNVLSLIKHHLSHPTGWLFGLCLLGTVSSIWSLDWRISIYYSIHFWLLFIFYLSLRDTPDAWRWFIVGGCAALAIQIFLGIWQFAAQNTAMTLPLGLNWPGDLLPTMSGASVVQLANGVRWLRAYGTFPHPNLLGGFGFVFLSTSLGFYFTARRWKLVSLVLFSLGVALLVFTFSRSAWLGVATLFIILVLRRKMLGLRNMVLPMIATLVVAVILLISFFPLFFTRVVDTQVQTEQVSNYTRLWLVQRTWELIRMHPILGTGVGTFSLALANHVAAFYKIEPIHNMILLVTSELGVGGLVLLIGLVFVVLRMTFTTQNQPGIVFSGILMGLLVISLFDHYLWTLAPGRILLFSIIGIWSGCIRDDECCGKRSLSVA